MTRMRSGIRNAEAYFQYFMLVHMIHAKMLSSRAIAVSYLIGEQLMRP